MTAWWIATAVLFAVGVFLGALGFARWGLSRVLATMTVDEMHALALTVELKRNRLRRTESVS